MRVLIPDLQDNDGQMAYLERYGTIVVVDSTAHFCEDIDRDPDGFAVGQCICGYETDPVPSLDLVVDQMMTHAVNASVWPPELGRPPGSPPVRDLTTRPRNENYAEPPDQEKQ